MKIYASALTLAIAAISILLFPATASAQFVAGSNASTTISADHADYQGDITILTGQVDVRQADVRILADKMTVYSAGSGGLSQSGFSKIVAEGHFYYLTSDQEVRGDKGVYTKVNDTFVVTGDVILKQKDGNVVTGDTLHYNITTRNAKVVGTCKGRRCGSEGRVNILIKNSQNLSGS